MGFYDAWLFPRVLDLVMQQKQMVPFRERIGKAASGRVLDIGIGSGLNLPFYGEQADHVCGVDPSAELLKFAQERAHEAHVPVELLRGSGEALPLDDKSIDTVVMTFTLCTVDDAARDAYGDSPGPQTRGRPSLRRTWPRTGSWRGSMAGQAHANLEARCRRLPSQSQTG